MNITREKPEELVSVLKIKIVKEDYEERINTILKDYRRKARMDGFRPGMVPFGLINKMYRKPVLVEEINKILSESLAKFIVDEKLHLLGEPMPNQEFEPSFDPEKEEVFEFAFDVGLAPEIEVNISNKEKFTFYIIKIDDRLRTQYTDNYSNRFGTFKPSEFGDDDSLITADLVQVDSEGNEVENGIRVSDARISVSQIKDENDRSLFIGRKAGESLSANLKKIFSNAVDLAALLKIKKEEAELINGEFKITLKTVEKFEKAEINQDFYDKLFGKDVIKSPDEYTQKLDAIIGTDLEKESNYKLQYDMRNYYIRKFKKDLPEEFLKRWLIEKNRDKLTPDQIEKDFNHFVEDLKWQLIMEKTGRDNDMKVTEDDVLDYARHYAQAQFAQYYGITDMPDDQLTHYARELLKKDENRRNFSEKKFEEKVLDFIKRTVKVDNKEISLEKFNKLFEK